jgi:chemotaxis protein methyltransferase CheR
LLGECGLEPLVPISDKEFALFQRLISREAGIYLSAAKKHLLVARLMRRLRDLGLSSFEAYYERVSGPAQSERILMLDCVCTNETRFFREPEQLEYLERNIVPKWRVQAHRGERERRIRVWSAACASGEEPYSLAMILVRHFPPASGWLIEITATDLSTRALERARAAVWPAERTREIPKEYSRELILEPKEGGQHIITIPPAVRSLVKFQRLNLNDVFYPLPHRFDLIVCRNVLIYFDAATRQAVVNRALERLSPSGYLFIGQSECLGNSKGRLIALAPAIYQAGLEKRHPARMR